MSVVDCKIEIFCGTGGVGKTTLATSRAFHLLKMNKKVLLMTMDPSKRLKEFLGISDKHSGELEKVQVEMEGESFTLDAILMNPLVTFERIFSKKLSERKGQRILELLFRPYGGMNELMSLIELNWHYKSGYYDVIILDTPPGGHFVDFLNSAQKFKLFFHQSFIEVFEYLSNYYIKDIRGSSSGGTSSIFTKLLATGIKKLLGYLDKVTGTEFLLEFVDAVALVYEMRQDFFQSIEFQKQLQNVQKTQWFLVSSVEQGKLGEAMELKGSVESFLQHGQTLILNKSLKTEWESWKAKDENSLDECEKSLQLLKEIMLAREAEIVKQTQGEFSKILHFPEILLLTPQEHVLLLANVWSQYAD